jgi:hypothetical protein
MKMMKAAGQRRRTAASVTVLTAVATYAEADRMGQQMTTKPVANRSMTDGFASRECSTCDAIVAVTTRAKPDLAGTGRKL